MLAALSVLVTSCLLLLASCGPRSDAPTTPNMTPRRYASLVRLAEGELQCNTLAYAYLGNDEHRMSGCNKHGDYILRCSGGGRICRWVATPFKQASFEMKCPEAQLKVTRLSDTAYGIEGCDQRVTYVMTDHRWSQTSANTSAHAAVTSATAP